QLPVFAEFVNLKHRHDVLDGGWLGNFVRRHSLEPERLSTYPSPLAVEDYPRLATLREIDGERNENADLVDRILERLKRHGIEEPSRVVGIRLKIIGWDCFNTDAS